MPRHLSLAVSEQSSPARVEAFEKRVLSLGVAWAIWALADMDQARETRSGALAGIIAAFPLLTGALLSLYGALVTLFLTVYLARA